MPKRPPPPYSLKKFKNGQACVYPPPPRGLLINLPSRLLQSDPPKSEPKDIASTSINRRHSQSYGSLERDARGALFGVGNLLRIADFSKGKITVDSPLDISTAPKYAIRGHQLGYRTQANSYDAWNAAQFEHIFVN